MIPVNLRREPGEESTDLYPGLVVHDGRVSGSITIGRTRLPMWAVIGTALRAGWDSATEDYYPEQPTPQYHDFDAEAAAAFFYNLTEHRGEFARLILLLADVERASTPRWDWTETRKHRERLAAQMRRCLALLEAA